MASERSRAKQDIRATSQDDPELDATLSAAQHYQLKVTQEKNRHAEQTQKNDLGFFGGIFGGEKSAPTFVAFLAALLGIVGAFFCWWLASRQLGEAQAFWGTQAERSIALSLASVAFIFGRGAK